MAKFGLNWRMKKNDIKKGDGFDCQDRDECMDGSANCHNLATCTNKEKGYDCNCKTGFIGDGTTECKDIDECLQGEDDCLGRYHLFQKYNSIRWKHFNLRFC